MNIKKTPDYKDHQLSQNIVIPAGIAEIQKPRMASDEHIPVVWIPAVHAGMTLLLMHLYNQEKTYPYKRCKGSRAKSSLLAALLVLALLSVKACMSFLPFHWLASLP
jgi:hypothetical protein